MIELIPFDPKPGCPKCGHGETTLRYSSGYEPSERFPEGSPEFINVTCDRCGFKRRMEVQSSKLVVEREVASYV